MEMAQFFIVRKYRRQGVGTSRLGRWRSIEVAPEHAAALTQLLQQRGHRTRAEVDVISVASTAPPTLAHPLVRLLDDGDLAVLEATPALFPQLPASIRPCGGEGPACRWRDGERQGCRLCQQPGGGRDVC